MTFVKTSVLNDQGGTLVISNNQGDYAYDFKIITEEKQQNTTHKWKHILVADWLSAIQCQDTPYQDIAAIVEFMYRGEINVSQVSFSPISTVQ
jgi:hypothetical protein